MSAQGLTNRHIQLVADDLWSRKHQYVNIANHQLVWGTVMKVDQDVITIIDVLH
jgi:gamma-glutamylcyclotransferase (GGCT)/AIG2-like uncharacterized protein YtfP